MTTFDPSKTDEGMDTVQNLLDNDEYVGRLTSGDEQKEAFVRELVTQIERLEKPAQEDFVKGLIETVTKEETLDDAPICEAACAILCDPTFGEIVYYHTQTFYSAYIEAVRAFKHRKQPADPFHGALDALLRVGHACAPFLVQGKQKEQRVKALREAWESAAQGLENEDDREYIQKQSALLIEHIQNAEEFVPPHPPLPVIERMSRRHYRSMQASERKERDTGEKGERMTPELKKMLRARIIELNNAGKTPEEIKQEPGMTEHRYARLVRELLDEGLIRDARFRKSK